MWRMQDGDRVLTESEWELFGAGVDLLRDSIEEDIETEMDSTETGIPVFDRLTPEQQLTLLADTAQALRDPNIPIPYHTAVNEGAIAAVFSMLRFELESELYLARTEGDGNTPTGIRRLLRTVCEGSPELEEPLPDETDTDADEWFLLVEDVEERILWDYDFAMGDEFLDLPPEEARAKLQRLSIDPDYYLAVPDEPTEAGLIAARQTLARLLGLPVPGNDGEYSVLADLYHDLFVGPVSPEEIAAWEGNPWVEVIGMADPECDCDFPTWSASFSQVLPAGPFQLAPAAPELVAEFPDGFTVERRGDVWVVRDEHGSYWCGLVENGWTGDPDAEHTLTFPTETEAKAAFAQADRMYGERQRRHEQAMVQLGLGPE